MLPLPKDSDRLSARNIGIPILHVRLIVLVALMFLVVGVLGFLGIQEYTSSLAYLEKPRPRPLSNPSFTNSLRLTLQMFVLRFPAGNTDNWRLELARNVAPLVTGLAGLLAVIKSSLWRLAHLSLLTTRGHTVIAGLSDASMALASDLRARGERVVFIDDRTSIPQMPRCKDEGCLLVAAAPTDEQSLAYARASRAQRIVVMDRGSSSSIDTALRVATLLGDSHAPIHVHIEEPRLYDRLHVHPGSLGKGRPEAIRPFHIPQIASRALLGAYPLDFGPAITPASTTRVHAVILGDSALALQCAVQALRIGHYANDTSITLWVSEALRSRLRHFLDGLDPSARKYADVRGMSGDPASHHTWSALREAIAAGDHRITFIITGRDEDENLAAWLSLPTLPQARTRALVELAQRDGLVQDPRRAASGVESTHFFDTHADYLTTQMVFDEALDELAKKLHERYLAQGKAEGWLDPTRPSHTPWETLGVDHRNANRAQADHVEVKARALRCTIDLAAGPRTAAAPLAAIPADILEPLSRCEHARWTADRILSGWRHGPTLDHVLRTHPSITSWENLSEPEREKDRDVVRKLPQSLALVGCVLVPGPAAGKTSVR